MGDDSIVNTSRNGGLTDFVVAMVSQRLNTCECSKLKTGIVLCALKPLIARVGSRSASVWITTIRLAELEVCYVRHATVCWAGTRSIKSKYNSTWSVKRLRETEGDDPVTLRQLMMSFRELVLQHPYAADLQVELHPHGQHHKQIIELIHLNLHETAVVIEAERK